MVAMTPRQPSEAWLAGGLMRTAGAAWIAAWLGALLLLARPWDDLGGVVGERWRWLARAALLLPPVGGATAGALRRLLVPPAQWRDYVGGLRALFYPVAVPGAAVLCVLAAGGHGEAVVVTLNALLGYWSGVDAAFSAWPLLHGRSPADTRG